MEIANEIKKEMKTDGGKEIEIIEIEAIHPPVNGEQSVLQELKRCICVQIAAEGW